MPCRVVSEALHEVYIPRIQRGDTCFAATALGARGPLLSVLGHFFQDGRWGSPVEAEVEEQRLTVEDQLFILMQAAAYLAATRGLGAPETQICYEHAESLGHLLGRPLLFRALIGQWRYALVTDKLSRAMQIAERLSSVAQEQNDPTLTIWAHNALATTHYFLGNFESARQHAISGVDIWRLQGSQSHPEDVDTPVVGCLCTKAFSEWHLGETHSCRAKLEEAISLAKELKDEHALTVAWVGRWVSRKSKTILLKWSAWPRLIVEVSTRDNFAQRLAEGAIYRGWARSASGDTRQGVTLIEQGIRDFRATGMVLAVPYYLALKAEALYFADRTLKLSRQSTRRESSSNELKSGSGPQNCTGFAVCFSRRWALKRTQIEASFREAIRIAREQKSISLATRAEASYAEYRRQKTDGIRRTEIPTASLLIFVALYAVRSRWDDGLA